MSLSRSLPVLLALLAAPLLLPLQRAAPAAEAPAADAPAEARCRDALSTVEMNRCLIGALEAVDRRLDEALARVAAEASGVPGGTFQTLWRENLTGFFRTSANPKEQAEAFRRERRKVCAYAKSMAFQGTGYGIFTASCELDLTETLLQQFEP